MRRKPPLILSGHIEERANDWVLMGPSIPGGEISVDPADVRTLEAPTTVITFQEEVIDDPRVSVAGVVDEDADRPVIRARSIVSHDAVRRLANELSRFEASDSAAVSTRRSALDCWLTAERQLLGLNLALWWGHLSMTSDFLQVSGGNVPGNTAAIYVRQSDEADASGELVSVVGSIGQKRLFFNPGTGKEFFLLVDHMVAHDEISVLAHRFHASDDGTRLSAWLRAERELLLRLS